MKSDFKKQTDRWFNHSQEHILAAHTDVQKCHKQQKKKEKTSLLTFKMGDINTDSPVRMKTNTPVTRCSLENRQKQTSSEPQDLWQKNMRKVPDWRAKTASRPCSSAETASSHSFLFDLQVAGTKVAIETASGRRWTDTQPTRGTENVM